MKEKLDERKRQHVFSRERERFILKLWKSFQKER